MGKALNSPLEWNEQTNFRQELEQESSLLEEKDTITLNIIRASVQNQLLATS
jgi:hypothetical protein